LAPALNDGAFDEAGRCSALAGGEAFLLGALAGGFVLDVADGQPEEFDHGVVGREVPAVLDDLAELVVRGLDRVRGVDDLPDFGWEREERDEPVPGRVPMSGPRPDNGDPDRSRRRPSARRERPRWSV
jgi:hypothetical protein